MSYLKIGLGVAALAGIGIVSYSTTKKYTTVEVEVLDEIAALKDNFQCGLTYILGDLAETGVKVNDHEVVNWLSEQDFDWAKPVALTGTSREAFVYNAYKDRLVAMQQENDAAAPIEGNVVKSQDVQPEGEKVYQEQVINNLTQAHQEQQVSHENLRENIDRMNEAIATATANNVTPIHDPAPMMIDNQPVL